MLIPGILQPAGIQAKTEVFVHAIVAACVAEPRRVDAAAIKRDEVIVRVAGIGLAHRVQAAALEGEVVQRVVHNGDTLERLRQQPCVTKVHDRSSGKYIACLDLGAQEPCFHGPPYSRKVILGIAGAIVGEKIDGSASTGTS